MPRNPKLGSGPTGSPQANFNAVKTADYAQPLTQDNLRDLAVRAGRGRSRKSWIFAQAGLRPAELPSWTVSSQTPKLSFAQSLDPVQPKSNGKQ
jgi:hypothetical protein